MDFYLTDDMGVRLRFPLLPNRLNVKTGALYVALNIIKAGEVKIPRGTALTGYSWNGTLPGESLSDASFVFDWKPPQRIIDQIEFWENNGSTLRFMVTELSINSDVFIESFAYEYFSVDSVSYTINLTARRDVLISTVPMQDGVPSTLSTNQSSSGSSYGTVALKNTSSYLNVRQNASTGSKSIGRLNHGARIQILEKSGNWYIIPYSGGINGKAYVYGSYVVIGSQTSTSGSTTGSSGRSSSGSKSTSSGILNKSSTYTVKSGDTLYSIAKKELGNGNRYEEIYTLNKTAIDARNKDKPVSKYTIYLGQVIKLPAM